MVFRITRAALEITCSNLCITISTQVVQFQALPCKLGIYLLLTEYSNNHSQK